MKRIDETLYIFVGKIEGEDDYTLILNNDGNLTIRELPRVGFRKYKLKISANNFFSRERSNELLAGNKTLTLTRMMSMPTGKTDRYGDNEYEMTPVSITFKRIALDVEIAYFDNLKDFE